MQLQPENHPPSPPPPPGLLSSKPYLGNSALAELCLVIACTQKKKKKKKKIRFLLKWDRGEESCLGIKGCGEEGRLVQKEAKRDTFCSYPAGEFRHRKPEVLWEI